MGRCKTNDSIDGFNFFIHRFMSDQSRSGQGFQLEYESTNVAHRMNFRTGECDGYFTTTNGTLSSPSYPGKYPDWADCFYIISQPINSVIVLDFINIDIESHSSCEWDYLEIRDGSSHDSLVLDKLCGNEIPAPMQSSQNQLRMK